MAEIPMKRCYLGDGTMLIKLKKPVFLSVDSLFHVAEFMEMPCWRNNGEQHDRKTLEDLRLVCSRFHSLLSRDLHLLQLQLIGDLYIDIKEHDQPDKTCKMSLDDGCDIDGLKEIALSLDGQKIFPNTSPTATVVFKLHLKGSHNYSVVFDEIIDDPGDVWLSVRNQLDKEDALGVLHFIRHIGRVLIRFLNWMVNGHFFISEEMDVILNPMLDSLMGYPMKTIWLDCPISHVQQMRPAIESGFFKTRNLGCRGMNEENLAGFLNLLDVKGCDRQKLKFGLLIEDGIKEIFISTLLKHLTHNLERLDSMTPSLKLLIVDVFWPLEMETTGEMSNRHSKESFSYVFTSKKPGHACKHKLAIDFRRG